VRLVTVETAGRAGFPLVGVEEMRLAVHELTHELVCAGAEEVELRFVRAEGWVQVQGRAARVVPVTPRLELSVASGHLVRDAVDMHVLHDDGVTVGFVAVKWGLHR
jgi:hypothetical protein